MFWKHMGILTRYRMSYTVTVFAVCWGSLWSLISHRRVIISWIRARFNFHGFLKTDHRPNSMAIKKLRVREDRKAQARRYTRSAPQYLLHSATETKGTRA